MTPVTAPEWFPEWWPAEGLADLGHDHWLSWTCWDPDRDLNPQYDGIESVERYAFIVWHRNPRTGRPCSGACTVDSLTAQAIEPNRPKWTLHAWEPLHVEPSILCRFTEPDGDGQECGDHGFIRDGRWVPA